MTEWVSSVGVTNLVDHGISTMEYITLQKCTNVHAGMVRHTCRVNEVQNELVRSSSVGRVGRENFRLVSENWNKMCRK